MINCMYFDTETLSLNPYRNVVLDENKNDIGTGSTNPEENKIITAQIGYVVDGKYESFVFKEWEFGEKLLIDSVLSSIEDLPKYCNVYTYNGMFDILYLLSRCSILGKSALELSDINELITSHIKHCDLLQYDNGYFCSLDKICNRYKIPSKCKYKGKDIKGLYEKGDWYNIISHGEDDIERLHALVTTTQLANRFTRMSIYG